MNYAFPHLFKIFKRKELFDNLYILWRLYVYETPFKFADKFENFINSGIKLAIYDIGEE